MRWTVTDAGGAHHRLNDYQRLARWLESRRYVVLTSLRRDGSPLSTPVAFLYEDGFLYFTVQTVRATVKRISRDARVALCAVDNADGQPPTDFRVHTRVERIDDPGQRTSKKIARRAVEGRQGYDFTAFLDNWLSHGRVVYRVPIDDETTRFKDGRALVEAVEAGEASFETDGAGVGGDDGKTLFSEQQRKARAEDPR